MKILPRQFLNLLKGRTLLVGIGNILRGDDGVGVVLLARLKEKVKAGFLDCGVAPENYLGKITAFSPETVIFIDAVDLGEVPGTMRLLDASELAEGGVSTHTLSPRMVVEYLQKELKGVKIFILGIQPESCRLGKGLSPEVEKTIDEFVRGLIAAG